MPIYEYVCPSHGLFEVITCTFTETSNCPRCETESPYTMSKTSFVLKEGIGGFAKPNAPGYYNRND